LLFFLCFDFYIYSTYIKYVIHLLHSYIHSYTHFHTLNQSENIYIFNQKEETIFKWDSNTRTHSHSLEASDSGTLLFKDCCFFVLIVKCKYTYFQNDVSGSGSVLYKWMYKCCGWMICNLCKYKKHKKLLK
jgi:hypothetical protein